MDAFPEDWTVDRLGNIGDLYKGSGISRAQADSGDIPAIRYGELYTTHNDYVKEYTSHISSEVAKTSVLMKRGDIAFAASGETEEEIGKCAAVCEEGVYAGGDLICLRAKTEIDPLFWGFMLNTPSVQKQKSAAAQGATVIHISRNAIADLIVGFPAFEEQKRIGIALKDIDDLIDNLSKRIEKKKAIKQGAMQELLTGKKRLLGFEGMWLTKELGQLVTMFSGGTPPSREASYYGGGIPWVSIGDITVAGKWIRTTEKTLSASGFNACSARMYPPMSLLFAMYASIGKCCISKDAVCSSQAILGLYDFRGVDIEYLFQNLSLREDEFAAMGQTGTQSNLSKQIVSKIKVRMPKDVAEQQAIAKVLGDMDAEITKLEAKREKLIGIKKGMMSDLLTGKVRLKGT